MKKILIIIIFLLILTNVGTIFYTSKQARSGQADESDEFYDWLNPQLKYSGEVLVDKSAYEIFKNNLIKIIEGLKKEGQVSEVAVFFRDLNNGPTFNINANDKFIPASLLKLPVLITYFHLAEDNPAILDQKLLNEEISTNLTPQFASSKTLEEGKQYTANDLLYRLIVYSDNKASHILIDYLLELAPDESLYLETYKDLGIIDAWYGDFYKTENISAKSYASIFRMLYNASYLSKEFSDKALDYLSKSEFNLGLRRGVPEVIPIAHKFGERTLPDIVQLHDCGIIYYPNNPYLLCIMTKGNDMDALSDSIGILSRAVYEEFDSRRLK